MQIKPYEWVRQKIRCPNCRTTYVLDKEDVDKVHLNFTDTPRREKNWLGKWKLLGYRSEYVVNCPKCGSPNSFQTASQKRG